MSLPRVFAARFRGVFAKHRKDVTNGARPVRRRPGFTLAPGLSPALGIGGVTTAIITVLTINRFLGVIREDPAGDLS